MCNILREAKRRTFRLGIAALLCVSAIPAWAGKSDDTLRWASRYLIDTADPYYNTSREALVINSQLVWDALIWRDPGTGEYKPLLATDWNWVDDTTLAVNLRQDVEWHDGTPFTAADAVYTFQRISRPDAKIAIPSNVNWVGGAEQTGEYSFNLLLKAPFPPAFEYLANMAVLPNNLYDASGNPPPLEKVVGTGPYRIVAFEPGSSISLERSDSYFEGSPKGRPAIGKIVYRTIPDASTQIAELLSGGIDWIWNVPPDQARALATRDNIAVESVETMRFSFITFNIRDANDNPLADVRVRQAIAHAINREQIASALVGEGSQVPLAGCFRTQFGCEQDVVQYEYDPEKAKALLAEAGYADGLTVDLQAFRSRDWTAAVASFLDAVGIKSTIDVLPYPAAQERLQNGQMQLYLQDNGWLGINDSARVLNEYFAGDNLDAVQDPALTELVKGGSSTNDADARRDFYSKAFKMIADKMFMLPMWTHPVIHAYNAEIDLETFSDENPRFYLARWK